MRKQKAFVVLCLLVFLIPANLSAKSFLAKTPFNAPENLVAFSTDSIQIKASQQIYDFTVELAYTPQQQAQGLMWRKEMAEDEGMLFTFNNVAMRSFWMRNTYLPLDILFIDDSGKIKHIHKNAIPLDETKIPSRFPVRHVLELNAGTTQKLGIKIGDIVIGNMFIP